MTASNLKRFPSLSHWGAFTAVVQDGKLIACEPFKRDSAPSAILQSMPGMVHSDLRIRKPAIRKAWLEKREKSDGRMRGSDEFVEVEWDVALGLVAEELARVRGDHGPESIFGGSYGWSSAGRLHHARTLTHKFLYAGGGCTTQTGNYSWGAAQFLLPHVIGNYAPVVGRVTDWTSMLGVTQLFIAFGGIPLRNTQVTSGGGGSHATRDWIEKACASDMEFVVVSPTRGDIPDGLNARWIAIRPNTDTAMMLGMAHTLLAAGRHDQSFLDRYCEGFEKFAAYLRGTDDGQVKDAGWASAICGVDADVITALALRASSRMTMLNCTWSLQRAHRGEQPYWTSIALAAMLGQIGLPGGGFAFGHGSINGVGSPRQLLPGPDVPAGKNPVESVIPVARFADMLLQPGEPYSFNGAENIYPVIRLMYWAGGNPFHHHQDLNRLMRAWAKPETIVVHESWWTPTAKRADIVLPATTTLERNDIGGSSQDNFVLAMHRAIDPQWQSRNDFDIYRELAARAGCESAFTKDRDEATWIRHIYDGMSARWRDAGVPAPQFDEFWSRGYAELPPATKSFVMMADFRDDPIKHALRTPSGKIELYSEKIAGFAYDDCPPHPSWMPPDEWLGHAKAKQWPLHLMTSQPPDKLHSQMMRGSTHWPGKSVDDRLCV